MHQRLLAALRFFVALPAILVTNSLALADEASRNSGVINDGRAWINMQAIGNTGLERWKWYAEFQPRWRDSFSNFDQRLIRPALIYELSEDSSVWLGYVNVQGYNRTSSLREHRLWQQYLTKFKINEHITVKSQTRTEQRYFVGFSDVGYKIRQKFAFYIPVAGSSEFSALIYDEVHHNFNTTDYGASRGFEQNRIFFGLEWKPQKNLSIEAGYLNQYFDNRREPDQNNHIFSTTIYYNLD